jgi:hypothetical protein
MNLSPKLLNIVCKTVFFQAAKVLQKTEKGVDGHVGKTIFD